MALQTYMLNEYTGDSIWKDNIDTVNIRSDILVTERVIDLLGNIEGKKILDAGCGNGKVSRILENRGAEVYGVDKVEEQIKTAQRVASDIEYFVSDITDFGGLNLSNDFDIVISLMTFLYLTQDEFVQALKEIKKHLKPGGRFVYGNIHPSRYGDNEKVTDTLPTAGDKSFQTTFYNHSLEFIKKSFENAGFKIDKVLEPLPTEKEIGDYPQLLELDKNIPQYLIIDTVSM